MSDSDDAFASRHTPTPFSLNSARLCSGFTIDAISVATGIAPRRLWSIEQGADPTDEETECLRILFREQLAYIVERSALLR
ncbi:hypothetical protein [Aurantimonas sp. 22II-16-19i]|uniref:hypothetical protein n=1 Tax=Aurantimonas sp. 22II-16-19i TaxID=1317114 RepID=UPI0009F7EC46|nr:hypothetical protein [Aurantimonas sp. 22II-16-19i]ORE85728.1 hypothetical protein ATO4_26307 [Aurantimonas sp. 22II-16-19i]